MDGVGVLPWGTTSGVHAMTIRRLFHLLPLLAWPAAAATPPGPLYDGSDGVSCIYYNLGAGIAWKTRLGDWIDAAGQPDGRQPLAVARVPSPDASPVTEWDVTALARGWLDGSVPNDGILLGSAPGGERGIMDFHSREAEDEALRPRLDLTWDDGSTESVPAQADASLDCSTVTALGARPFLKVGLHSRVAMRFALPQRKGPLRAAVLRLHRLGGKAGGPEFALYRIRPPLPPPPGAPAPPGLAAGATTLKALARNPEVLFVEGFESDDWLRNWTEFNRYSGTQVTGRDPDQKFAPIDGRALKVTVPTGKTLGLHMGYHFLKKLGHEPEEVYFRYYLRLADNWLPVADGGKMPGISGTYDRAGWGGRGANGKDGWSARGAFKRMPSADNPMHGYTRVGNYVYQPDHRNPYGEVWEWGGDGGLQLERNRWYCIEQFVHLNTPGKHDGELKAWVDGVPVLDRSGIRFRDVPDLKIDKIWMNVYHGGTTPTPRDISLYIDDVVVAKRYIGPAPR